MDTEITSCLHSLDVGISCKHSAWRTDVSTLCHSADMIQEQAEQLELDKATAWLECPLHVGEAGARDMSSSEFVV